MLNDVPLRRLWLTIVVLAACFAPGCFLLDLFPSECIGPQSKAEHARLHKQYRAAEMARAEAQAIVDNLDRYRLRHQELLLDLRTVENACPDALAAELGAVVRQSGGRLEQDHAGRFVVSGKTTASVLWPLLGGAKHARCIALRRVQLVDGMWTVEGVIWRPERPPLQAGTGAAGEASNARAQFPCNSDLAERTRTVFTELRELESSPDLKQLLRFKRDAARLEAAIAALRDWRSIQNSADLLRAVADATVGPLRTVDLRLDEKNATLDAETTRDLLPSDLQAALPDNTRLEDFRYAEHKLNVILGLTTRD